MSTLTQAPSAPARNAGTSYIQHPPDGSFDTIVVGSGIGGLTAAALLAKRAGQKVLVLERHYTAGGFTHVFRRPGYEWDVGIHYIGEMRPGSQVRAMFDEITEGRVEWNPMADVYDRIVIGERTYDFVRGRERFRERLHQYFPNETQAIDRYLTDVREATRASKLFHAEKILPSALSKVAGPLMRRKFLKYTSQTTADALARLTSNKELIGVLTGQWGDYGLPPAESSYGMHCVVAKHYLDGGYYPVGGSSRIAAAIAPVIERAGGQILVSAEVERIVLDEQGRAIGVRMTDGRELRAKTVLSDAGAWNTYAKLLPEGTRGCAETVAEIERIPASFSHICLYVGLRREAREPEFGNANLWIYPGPDHDANTARFVADPDQPFAGMFISFPSAKDPAFAENYPGRATIEVVTLAPYGWFERWAGSRWKHRGADYDALKQKMAGRLRAELEKHVPAVRGRIECCELSTPLSTEHFANFHRGEIYGLSLTPQRFKTRALGVRTPVKNLYLTGADAVVPGVVGAMMAGTLTASAVLRRNVTVAKI